MSGSRASKGCAQCRKRKVKCDETKPSCQRCLKRNEDCSGYRELTAPKFIFKNENERTAIASLRKSQPATKSTTSTWTLSQARSSITASPSASLPEEEVIQSSDLLSNINLNPTPWLVPSLTSTDSSTKLEEKNVIDSFFNKYVLPPCTSTSTPGFLEYLPMLFEEVPIAGRISLRHAVRAVSYASLATSMPKVSPEVKDVRRRADTYYGKALKSLSETLASEKDEEKVSDYALMTVVLLDLFESIFIPNPERCGSHTEGMANILRLRTSDQLRTPRGWSLWRLSHHRIQRQQLAFPDDLAPCQSLEQEELLSQLNEDVPENKIEKTNFEIVRICRRARQLRAKLTLDTSDHDVTEILDVIGEMHKLEAESVAWRAGPCWAYKTVPTASLTTSDGQFLTEEELRDWPEKVGLYPDLWIIYELNYQRTGRLLLHTQILECLALWKTSDVDQMISYSQNIITELVEEILQSVPQSLGDVSSNGFIIKESLLWNPAGSPGTSAIGAYFLLWCIKVTKEAVYASEEQRSTARKVFGRIRDVTGMRERGLGEDL